MLVEVSVGEVIDKLSILEIKASKILNSEKLCSINKEIEALQSVREKITPFPHSFWYSLLIHINTNIWHLTDEIKSFSYKNDPDRFSELSHRIFELNQQRFRIKNRFNKETTNSLQEQKSYSEKTIHINITDLNVFYQRLSVINKLSIEYDIVELITPFQEEVKKIFGTFPFCVKGDCENTTIDLSSFENVEDIYYFPPLTYFAGGLLGDFILSLSIVAEKFWESGRKAVIYLGNNHRETFRFPLETVYNDTNPIISIQPYVKSYKIHENEPYDIDLTIWRESNLLEKKDWFHIYSSTYNIKWGTRQWLFLEKKEGLEDLICIHSSKHRINTKFDFNEIIKNNPNKKWLFISQDISEYTRFRDTTKCSNIPFLEVSSLYELYVLINSCGFFIGNLSMPLAVADSLFKNRIGLLCGGIDDIHVIGIQNYLWPNLTQIHN
jgi:hypothetical protein